ncbi:hypothetical protein [Mucilaginibacter sp.]|uniref:hypothetical protein n=1 Tax=Mucilaginibacter sp. TaxID=1882438 RepID=UPI00263731C6|nr:hypothetical protein [Mucilaginibacter sp.]MDB4924654.1 hypothetical protein [Mucilaginibacter sp.]
MENYNKIWRSFFAICLIAIGIQQLIVGGFMPVIIPPSPIWLSGCIACVWVVSILLIVSSAAILFNINARTIAVYLGAALLLLLLIFHIPYQLQTNLHFLGGWGNAFKILVLTGGAFVAALSLPKTEGAGRITNLLEKLLPAGRFFFAITMVVFGITHFVYIQFVAMLVPAWTPWHIFWGYLAGVALIAGGLGIILNIQLRLAANVLGVIIFIWLITLHIPRAIADPYTGHGNEVVSVFEALGFSGIAFLIAANAKSRKA